MKGYRLPITQLKTDTRVTKKMRIKSMVPYWKSGLFIIPCENNDLSILKGGMAVLVDELTRYPKVATDDTIDALAYMNQLTHRPNVVSILKQIPDNSFFGIRSRIKKPKNKLGVSNVRDVAYAGR